MQALNASNLHWNMHSTSTDPAFDLSNAANLEYTYYNAAQYVHASRDWTLPSQLNELNSEHYAAVGQATANLNDAIDDAATPADVVKAQYYAQNTVRALALIKWLSHHGAWP